VAYSNEAKMELLGVPEATMAAVGAVSAETALAMAAAAPRSRSGWSISALPPRRIAAASAIPSFPGDRDEIRRQAMLRALEMLRETAA